MIHRRQYWPLLAPLALASGIVACGEPADSGEGAAGLGTAMPPNSGEPTGTSPLGDPAAGTGTPTGGAPGHGTQPTTDGSTMAPTDSAGGSFTPSVPGTADPSQPGGNDSNTSPGGGDPTMPGGGDPTMPGGGDPTMPGGGDPTMPGGGDPTMPGGGDPTMPGGGDPTMPGGGDPTMPGGGGSCTFTVQHELSSAVSTVGIVTWSTDMAVESANIEFGPAGGSAKLVAPVDLDEPEYRTLLLGMKGETDYEFRIVAEGGGQTCTSEAFGLTTGPVPNAIPVINRQPGSGAATPGFYVTSAGIGNLGGGFPGGGGGGGGGGGSYMFIFDHDGDIVWWAQSPANCSRARMDWEGKNMWMTALNYPQSGGEMRRVSMDGLDAQNNVQGLGNNHHDFTVVPGGIVTSISYSQGCDSIIERSPDGTTKTVVANVSDLYQPGNGLGGGSECHVNAITYQPGADTYVISDRNPSIFARFGRDGSLKWQFGGSNPKGMHFTGSWNVNHGHHLLDNGNFLFFNNENGNQSPVKEYSLDEASGQASLVWEFTGGGGSATLGDAQRLPNGNTIITYSNSGTIVEVDSGKNEIQRFTTGSLGYTTFRETLYGPPPR